MALSLAAGSEKLNARFYEVQRLVTEKGLVSKNGVGLVLKPPRSQWLWKKEMLDEKHKLPHGALTFFQTFLKSTGGSFSGDAEKVVGFLYNYVVDTRSRFSVRLRDVFFSTVLDICEDNDDRMQATRTFVQLLMDPIPDHEDAGLEDLLSLVFTLARENFEKFFEKLPEDKLCKFAEEYELTGDSPRSAVRDFIFEAEEDFQAPVEVMMQNGEKVVLKPKTVELSKDMVIAAISTREAKGKKTGLPGILSELENMQLEIDSSKLKEFIDSSKLKEFIEELLEEKTIMEKIVADGKRRQFSLSDKPSGDPVAVETIRSAAAACNEELGAESLSGTKRDRESNVPSKRFASEAPKSGENGAADGFFDKQEEEAFAKKHAKGNADSFAARKLKLLNSKERSEEVVKALELKPVYLGSFPEYANLKEFKTSTQMRELIINDASKWSEDDYKFSRLQHFFVKAESGSSRYVTNELKFDIDHALPQAWGGLDHPLNYFLMPACLNKSFGVSVDEKFALVGKQITRSVRAFASRMALLTRGIAEKALVLIPNVDYK